MRSPDDRMPAARPRLAGAVVIGLALLGSVAGAARAQGTLPNEFADSLVVGGLDYPVGFAFLPDGRVLVAEQKSARIRLVVNGALAATDPIVTLPGIRTAGAEQGLLGIAVDPDWPARPYFYVHCDDAAGPAIRVSRFTALGDPWFRGDGGLTVDPGSRYDLLNDAPDSTEDHNGGTLRFGLDRMLYVSLGDDFSFCGAQDTVSLRGVILRLDASRLPVEPGGSAPRALVTPPGNPFGSHPNPNARLVWALGLRNPFRFQVDPLDGSLWVGDVGDRRYEEIDHVTEGGHNYGWPVYEADSVYASPCTGGVRGDDPVYFYDRTGFTASVICAGAYRRPPGAPRGFPAEYEGSVFLGDYYAGFIRRLVPGGGGWVLAPPVPGQPDPSDWGTGFRLVSDWAVGPDGALWYCRQADAHYTPGTGEIRRIVSTAAPPPPAAVDFRPPSPSPAPGHARLSWALPRASLVELTLFDAGGRIVRRLVGPEPEGAGDQAIDWDGLDGRGRAVPPGLYIARLLVDGASYNRRFPLLR